LFAKLNSTIATESAAAILKDSKGTASLANKFRFLANKLQAATSGTTLSSANNQETVQGQLNRCISELTEANLDIGNWIEFWLQRMTTYKLTGPLAHYLLSVPASQAFCGDNFVSLRFHDSKTQKSNGEIS